MNTTSLAVLCIDDPFSGVDSSKQFPKRLQKCTYVENANSDAYCDSKFFGSVCDEFMSNGVLIFPNAQSYLTKKGGIPFGFHFSTKLPNCIIKFILVSNESKQSLKKGSPSEKLYNLAISSGYQVLSSEEFIALYETDYYKEFVPAICSEAKFTCGLNAVYDDKNLDKVICAHSTRGYGLNFDTVMTLKQDNENHFGQVYEGIVIDLLINNKSGGQVVYIPALSGTSHLTINTTIKAVLSGPIVQKFIDSEFEFNLQSIDPTAKVDSPIVISTKSTVQVVIIDWYQYLI